MKSDKLRKTFWFVLPLSWALVLGGWTLDYFPDNTEAVSKSFREGQRRSRKIAQAPRAGTRHTREFKTTGLHGSQFIQDKDSCKSCHGEDLKGGSTGRACATCHRALEYFDHFGDSPGSHGAAFFKAPENCAGCHGSDWKGKDGAYGCLDCHNFPHSGAWSRPQEHGDAYLKGGRSAEVSDPANCLYCHSDAAGFQERHPAKFLNCGACHPIIPHPDKRWTWGKHAAEARTYEGKCLHCHTDMKRLTPSMSKGCYTCHKGTNPEPVMKFVPKPTAQVKSLQDRVPAHAPTHWKSYEPFDREFPSREGVK